MEFDGALFPNADVYSNAWDNVWEWGEAKRAYNFANAGYKVSLAEYYILSCIPFVSLLNVFVRFGVSLRKKSI